MKSCIFYHMELRFKGVESKGARGRFQKLAFASGRVRLQDHTCFISMALVR